MKEYDVIVIGSGPGGYVCAIRCAQLGFQTALVEKYPTLGGTCLNVGCIPSKAWLDSSERFEEIKHLGGHGIQVKHPSYNFSKMRSRVEKVVSTITQGVDFLMKKNKITVHQGLGQFADAHTITITGPRVETIKGKNIVIATGSKPAPLPGIKIDKKRIITSTEALALRECPSSLAVIGGGAIGLEMGSVFGRLGAQVTVVEYADSLIPSMDRALGKELLKVLRKQGLKFHLETAVQSVENTGPSTILTGKNKRGEQVQFNADYTLLSVGRRPYTEGLGLAALGITLDKGARIQVDKSLRTNVSHIYAIGDVIRGPMLAHKAEEEGVFVAEQLAGQRPHLLSEHLIPGVVYTWPEVASVGNSEEQLKTKGTPYKTGHFPFKASGRAKASGESDGFIKILSDAQTDELLGVHMIGPRCADMIAQAVVAMEYRASAEDMARICHPHPTFSEAIKEAALDACEKRAIHF